ncbi:hypothetical protein MKK88_03105 [Methylobacterium sp. E-005]|uniref:hypothetical protein n=1 Tax=Methylobacterium sp. E-005 TaxID=2836549 RepID=UPI001FB91C01|nr:hypothetical protein [Methylobacterium sp. E-005]MCJ2084984.1 hypothetical protein [Methylobacterium sp. E-005]
MRRPDQPALTDAGAARVTMPFLPTLAVIAILGVASFYCPSTNPIPTPHAVRAQADPLTTESLAETPTAFAHPAAVAASPGRLPAALIFAEAFPLTDPGPNAAGPAARVAASSRPAPRLTVANRRACPGRRCPETAPRGLDPFAAAHADATEPAGRTVIPGSALPFADAVAETVTETVTETLSPATRVVGDAADFVRSRAAAVQGSVSLAVADCLR